MKKGKPKKIKKNKIPDTVPVGSVSSVNDTFGSGEQKYRRPKKVKVSQREKDQKVLEDFVEANSGKQNFTPVKVENIDTTNPAIKATLKVLGRTYESTGNTPDEVLRNFKTQDWIKGAGVLTIEKDGRKREKIIPGSHIRNVFGMASGTMRTISLKWITQLF